MLTQEKQKIVIQKTEMEINKELLLIETQIEEDLVLDESIACLWEEREKTNKEAEDFLIKQITNNKPEWVKERRLEYLEQKLNKLNKEYLGKYQEVNEWRNKITNNKNEKYIYNMYANYLEQTRTVSDNIIRFRKTPWRNILNKNQIRFLINIEKEIKKIKFEIDCWNNSELKYEDGKFTEEEIEEARQSEPFNFLEFNRHDIGRHWTKCPFHKNGQEKTPSFCYHEDSKRCSCYACGWNGNCVDLVMKLNDLDFRSAVALILNR